MAKPKKQAKKPAPLTGERRWRELQIQKRKKLARGESPPEPVWTLEKAQQKKPTTRLHAVTIYATVRWFRRCSRAMEGDPQLAPLAGVLLEAVDHTGVIWQVTPDGVRRCGARR